MKLPKARTENLLEQNLKDETLLYDLTIDKAFNLNETLTIIYKACGQNMSFEEIKRKHKFTDEFIYLALDELKRNNLLAEEYTSPFAGTSRREVIKKVGLATMFALPLISGLVAPKAVNAASGDSGSPVQSSDIGVGCNTFTGGRKSDGTNCYSGFCVDTRNGSACCNNSGGSYTLLPGGNFTSTGDSDEANPMYDFLPADAPAPTCESQFRCCDASQTPYGTCTYEALAPPNDQGMIPARLACNCTCP